MGSKDGTRNLKAEDPTAIDVHVWVPADADDKGGGWPAAPIWWCVESNDRRALGPAVAE